MVNAKSLKLIILLLITIIILMGFQLQSTSGTLQNFKKSALENLVDYLKVYDVYDKSGQIKLIRHGKDNDGGYIVPEIAFNKSDVLMGYGIANDIVFEEKFSDIYQKPSYAFDCTINGIQIKNKLCSFSKECISNNNFIKEGKKLTSFSHQLHRLGLENKKIFLKMDIEGAEYQSFEDIYQYSNNITGIVIEIHFFNQSEQILDAINLLSNTPSPAAYFVSAISIAGPATAPTVKSAAPRKPSVVVHSMR